MKHIYKFENKGLALCVLAIGISIANIVVMKIANLDYTLSLVFLGVSGLIFVDTLRERWLKNET